MVQEGKPAAEAFPLPAAGGSEVMNRPVLYCARCGAEIQTRHIVWQINRWPAAVDIRALQLYALPVRHETATALVRRRPTRRPASGHWPLGSLSGNHAPIPLLQALGRNGAAAVRWHTAALITVAHASLAGDRSHDTP